MRAIVMRSLTIGFALAGSLLVLAGCDSRDPYRRTDVWQPTGANAGNLAAMVADPQDLLAGRGDARMNASEPAIAASRIWADTPKQTLSGSGGGGSGGSSSGSSGGGGGGGGGGSAASGS
jgi:type IV pilus biogenesis protein CpaD/CtpE